MKVSRPISNILNSIESNFSNQYKKIRENISLCAYSMIRCQTINTAEIARYMHEVNGLGFKANDMKVYRLLKSNDFHVDDKMWRGYMRLLFGLIEESGYFKKKQITINVDYTSDTDDFLILFASINRQGESIPLYFSMRNYPKKSGMHDQKKLELAFFRALKHILPKGFEYLIVADRGFAHNRLIDILESCHFKYVLRANENLLVKIKDKTINLNDLPHKNQQLYDVDIQTWQRKVSVVKRVSGNNQWILLTNHEQQNLSRTGRDYEGRFSIETMFKNKTSGGFDLEKLQIKKYNRFKRILFISCIAYTIMIFSGFFIKDKLHDMKKNFPED